MNPRRSMLTFINIIYRLVNRLSSNLGYLATITNSGGGPTNGSLPIPVLEAPVAASDYLKNLYNQLRAYFVMGQKGGFFNKAQPPKSENMSPSSSQQQRPPSPSKQQRVFSGPQEGGPQGPSQDRAASVTGKRDRQQTEQEPQADQQGREPDAKRERIDTASTGQGDTSIQSELNSSPVKNAQTIPQQQQPNQLPQSAPLPQYSGQQQQLQQQQNMPQLPNSASSVVPGPSASGPQAKRRKASQDNARSNAGGPPTPRLPNQQQPIARAPSAASQRPNSTAPGDASAASASELQQQQPSQQSSTIPPHIQQHMQAVAAANAAQSPNTSQQQGPQFQQPTQRAPSAMSMQSPMAQPGAGPSQHFRQTSVQPGTPLSGSFGPGGQQMQPQNGQSQQQGSIPPRPPGQQQQNMQQQQPQQSQMPGQQGQMQPQQQGQQSNGLPENIDMLAQEMMRLQSMMTSARQFRANHDLYGKMPVESRQHLDQKLTEQEHQFNQMRMAYERHMNEQQQQREREHSGQPQQQPNSAMSPPPQHMQALQQQQQRLAMQQPQQQGQRPQQLPMMPPPQQQQLQQAQRQASISSVHHQANMSNAGSPAASMHESPALSHASPHGMTRPGTSQSMRQGEGQMMPPPGRPMQQHSGEASSPGKHCSKTSKQPSTSKLTMLSSSSRQSRMCSNSKDPSSIIVSSLTLVTTAQALLARLL